MKSNAKTNKKIMKHFNWEYFKSQINQQISETETKKSTVKSKRTNPLYMDWYFCI